MEDEITFFEHGLLGRKFCLSCLKEIRSGFYQKKVDNVKMYYQYPQTESIKYILYRCNEDLYLLRSLLHPYFLFYFYDRYWIPLPLYNEKQMNPHRYILSSNRLRKMADILKVSDGLETVTILNEGMVEQKRLVIFSLTDENIEMMGNLYHLLKDKAKDIVFFCLVAKEK